MQNYSRQMEMAPAVPHGNRNIAVEMGVLG